MVYNFLFITLKNILSLAAFLQHIKFVNWRIGKLVISFFWCHEQVRGRLSALRHCESLHDTKTVNYYYRPSFSDLTKDLINFPPHMQNQEHQLITEQHNESYGSEQDIVYGEIELVKKRQMYHLIFVIQSFYETI